MHPPHYHCMMINPFAYFILFVFIASCASAFAYIMSTIIHDKWTSVFIPSMGCILFMLENIELNKILDLQEIEIRVLRETSQATILQKTNEFKSEIKRLERSYLLLGVGRRKNWLRRYFVFYFCDNDYLINLQTVYLSWCFIITHIFF
jgi:hypothetical protein